jgi:uncharacterized protein (DUF697 family)
MNQPTLLHIVERLEGLLGKLPETIQGPILRELTPLKELFLQHRPPRFVFTGSDKIPLREVVAALFASMDPQEIVALPLEGQVWQDVRLGEHGAISILEARGAGGNAKVRAELSRQPADVIFRLLERESKSVRRKSEPQDLADFPESGDRVGPNPAVIGIVFEASKDSLLDSISETKTDNRFVRVFRFPLLAPERLAAESRELLSILARHVPNEARIEMIRISRDREAQREVAQSLVKSTAAVCTAIGMQPIPLADLPILTTLQLVMVSGIMYVSGRERSLRAATEFIGALGANVGAGMLLREGARALLKFFPGWGNVICGMVAGAGTYAIGRAAIVFFLEGVSLKDARRIYLSSRKRPVRPALAAPGQSQKAGKRKK